MFRHSLMLLVLMGCSAAAEKAVTQPQAESTDGARVEVARLETQRAQSKLSFTGEVRGLRGCDLSIRNGDWLRPYAFSLVKPCERAKS